MREQALRHPNIVDFNLGEKFLFGRVNNFFVPILYVSNSFFDKKSTISFIGFFIPGPLISSKQSLHSNIIYFVFGKYFSKPFHLLLVR